WVLGAWCLVLVPGCQGAWCWCQVLCARCSVPRHPSPITTSTHHPSPRAPITITSSTHHPSPSTKHLNPIANRRVIEVREHQVVEDDGVRAHGVRDGGERRGNRVGGPENLRREIGGLHLHVIGYRRTVADLDALEAARAQQILQRLGMHRPDVR